ncbi:MAG: hypothetical protein IPJ88_12230 [Myxococcales bacterium]|nr:MAG: hypothetical protein IPJ88_12230 [Myxococcales bacterium]
MVSDATLDADSGAYCLTGVDVVIKDNHPSGQHELVISYQDAIDGVEKTYDIQGGNTGHGHEVTVSSAEFEALLTGQTVTLMSTEQDTVGNGHTHEIVLSCS